MISKYVRMIYLIELFYEDLKFELYYCLFYGCIVVYMCFDYMFL